MKAAYVCDPGAPRDGRYNAEQLAEVCRCKCPRSEHWWGEGPCGCGKCDYFRQPRVTARDVDCSVCGAKGKPEREPCRGSATGSSRGGKVDSHYARREAAKAAST